jgi:hypothetical protein
MRGEMTDREKQRQGVSLGTEMNNAQTSMLPYDLGFAICRCGFRTPIQPFIHDSADANRKWGVTELEFPFVACAGCRHFYRPLELILGSTVHGLSPYHEDGPFHVFGVSINCGEGLHCSDIQAIAVRNSDMTEKEVLEEIRTWTTGELICPHGHVQRFPSNWIPWKGWAY